MEQMYPYHIVLKFRFSYQKVEAALCKRLLRAFQLGESQQQFRYVKVSQLLSMFALPLYERKIFCQVHKCNL